jgi:hypothetical protein
MKMLLNNKEIITVKEVNQLVESIRLNESALEEILRFYEIGWTSVNRSLVEISKKFKSVDSLDNIRNLSGPIKELQNIFIHVDDMKRDYQFFNELLQKFVNPPPEVV